MNNNSLTKRDIFFAFIITCFYLIDHNSKSLTLKPQADRLIIFDENGKAITLKITDANFKDVTIGEASPDHQKKIADICREGRGFCEIQTSEVPIKVSPHVKKHYAEICKKELDGLSLFVQNEENSKNIQLTAYDIARVLHSHLKDYCDNKLHDTENSKAPLWISEEDSKTLHINPTKHSVRGSVGLIQTKFPIPSNKDLEK